MVTRRIGLHSVPLPLLMRNHSCRFSAKFLELKYNLHPKFFSVRRIEILGSIQVFASVLFVFSFFPYLSRRSLVREQTKYMDSLTNSDSWDELVSSVNWSRNFTYRTRRQEKVPPVKLNETSHCWTMVKKWSCGWKWVCHGTKWQLVAHCRWINRKRHRSLK